MAKQDLSSGSTIIDGMATILWGASWASAYEDNGGSLSGMKIEEVMPPVPLAAFIDAARLSGMIEEANGCGLFTLLNRAAEADAAVGKGNQEDLFNDLDYQTRFGQCLAWQGTGNGASWADDHAEIDMVVPLFEPNSTVDEAMETVAADRPGIRA